MEEEVEIVVCIGSRSGSLRHVLVSGLSADQEDDLYAAVEAVYGDRLMSDYMQTCEFWATDFPIDEVRHVVESKLFEMNIGFSITENVE